MTEYERPTEVREEQGDVKSPYSIDNCNPLIKMLCEEYQSP